MVKYGLLCIWLVLGSVVFAQEAPSEGNIQIAHLVQDLAPVDVYLGDELLFENLQPAQLSDFKRVEAGTYELRFTEVGRAEQILSRAEVNVEPASWVFVPFFGSLAQELIGASQQNLSVQDIPRDHARMYFYNALEGTTMDINIDGARFDQLAAGALQVWDFPAGEHDVLIRSSQTADEILLDLRGRIFAPYELYMVTLTQVDGETVASFSVTPLVSSIQIFHFVPDLPELALRADDQIIFAPVAFGSRGALALLPGGVYDIRLETFNTEDVEVYFEAEAVEILPSSQFTLEISGVQRVGNLETRFSEAAPPEVLPQNATVTLLHRLTNTPPVDIRTPDGLVLIQDLAFRDGEGMLDLPADSYDFQIVLPDETVLYDLEDVQLEAGKHYTFAFIGRLNDVQAGRQRIFVDEACLFCQ